MNGIADVIWHDLEHCGYRADIPAWRSIVGRAGRSTVAELGAGSGRVSLALAADGHTVTAVDSSARLLSALRARRLPGADVETVCCDARSLRLPEAVGTILAPALLVQMVGGRAERASLFAGVVANLCPGGLFAAAVDDRLPSGGGNLTVAGTVRSARLGGSGWSTEISALTGKQGSVTLHRTRQSRSSRSTCSDEVLDCLSLRGLASEARSAGLREVQRLAVPATGLHSGVTVVVFRGP